MRRRWNLKPGHPAAGSSSQAIERQGCEIPLATAEFSSSSEISRRGGPPMAGGDGSLRRCTAKSVEEAAAATGLQGSLARCSTKRKAKKEDAAAGVENRLSAKEIRWILAQKPKPPPPRYQALKRSNPELTPRPGEEEDEAKMRLYILARAFYELEERLPRMQEKVRSELERKGYVEVDDEYRKRKAEGQAVVDWEWPKIVARFKDLGLSEGSEESDSDEEEEEEE
ncbi:hypothetical protein C2845_PM11G08030 [Panicum miliaceum]|uniref:Uncharacterized protein n=1 Tax=Panicum miliaceum TaxID=4540 RepID=A0A3L6RXA1_PANMI|nr:hypothetical protein C2845_PM11G08030 [Panicum miliaceum]